MLLHGKPCTGTIARKKIRRTVAQNIQSAIIMIRPLSRQPSAYPPKDHPPPPQPTAPWRAPWPAQPPRHFQPWSLHASTSIIVAFEKGRVRRGGGLASQSRVGLHLEPSEPAPGRLLHDAAQCRPGRGGRPAPPNLGRGARRLLGELFDVGGGGGQGRLGKGPGEGG